MSFVRLFLGLAVPLSLDVAMASASRDKRSTLPGPQGPTVRWTATRASSSGDSAIATLRLRIDAGWHVYSLTQDPAGPYPLRIRDVAASGWQVSGPLRGPAPERYPTSAFGIPVEWYNDGAEVSVPLKRTGNTVFRRAPRLAVRYQACSATLCLPPTQIEVAVEVADAESGR
ncbi:MAG: hypothetical protein IBJ03_01885 [Gemmatimonadaceae bacterium]|nr:hypothetical protein [Gemmatimonadaceae bacterium]